MAKQVFYSQEAREKLKRGIDTLSNAVKVTLGPKGRNVVIDKEFGPATVTKDGVTVAREIELEDKVENLGAKMVKDVAGKTADFAGDGTTTATVLSQKIYSEGMKLMDSEYNPIEIKEGMDFACNKVCEELKAVSKKYSKNTELIEIATVSSNNDAALGKLVGEAFIKAGVNGLVEMGESKSTDTILKFSEGYEIDRGYISPYFINSSEKDEAKLENPYILLFNGELSEVPKELITALEIPVTKGASLLIIAKDVKDMALQTLVINKIKNGMKVCAVRAPGYGDICRFFLEDIAVATGGIVVDDNQGNPLSKFEASWFGRAENVRVSLNSTILTGLSGKKEDIKARIDELTLKLSSAKSDFDRAKIQERISKLDGSACTILVGGNSDVEVKEKKDRVEDAMNAVKSAIQEGIIAGGGCSYLYVANKLKKLKTGNKSKDAGIHIVLEALKEPFRQILSNAGLSPDLYVQKLEKAKYGTGVDARTGKILQLIPSGIIDPLKVARLALQNAVSIVGTLLTTECVIH